MAVYVDDVKHRLGKMIMCHMWADTLEELLEMVDRIGLNRKWIQGHPELSLEKAKKASWVHFDVALTKKLMAIKFGAVVTDRFGPVEFLARRNLDNEDPDIRARAQKQLDTIARIRATA